VRLAGPTLHLAEYVARTTSNAQFDRFDLRSLDRFFLPPSMTGLVDVPPLATRAFLEDDNRGAVSADPVVTIDGTAFHLSVKGVGSAVDPFAAVSLDRERIERVVTNDELRRRIRSPTISAVAGEPDRWITGEVWLRGSPYGGQGLAHAQIAFAVSERADLTSLAGFRIAPVVKVAYLSADLEERIRALHWFRRFRGPIVQEIRLVPSNVRIYFHARSTVGSGVRDVFDRFGIDRPEAAIRFEVEFLRSAVPLLTLFARTLRRDPPTGRYFGLDFHDVWLDKDAVVAPSGTVFFVDLEGIEEADVERDGVREKIEDQVYRSLYELLFAYEQIDAERVRRFGGSAGRKHQFEEFLRRAVAGDPFVRLRSTPTELALEIRNPLGDEDLYTAFPLVDRT
jgi:hypothetical protein